MSAITNASAESLLRMMFGRATNAFPATFYIALSSTLPTDVGANVTEPTDPAYARAAVANSTGNWVVGTSRTVENATEIQFTQATESWGDYDYFAIYGSLTAGTFYGWGALSATVSPILGDVAVFRVGDLVITSPAGV